MNTKTMIIIAVIIIVVLVVALYLLYLRSSANSRIESSVVSKSIQQYQQEFQLCAQQYAQAFSTFIQNSPQGFNQAELQTLAQLQSCMNNAANGIAQIAKSLGQDPFVILSNYLGEAILIVAGGIGASQILKGLKVYINNAITNGGTAASALDDAITQLYVSLGIITADVAAGVKQALQQLYSLHLAAVSNFAYDLEVAGIITAAVAASIIALYGSDILADLLATIDILPVAAG